MGKTTLLQGPAGVGKTRMACLTAVRKPVHVIDVDRKIGAMAILADAIAKGELTHWEVNEPIAETGGLVTLETRAKQFADNTKPTIQPRGWSKFAQLAAKLDTDPVAKAAGTWFIDSATMLAHHLKKLVIYQDPRGHSTLNDRNWGSFLGMWTETLSILIDSAKSQDKDLILSVHERVSEVPTEGAKAMKEKDKEGIVRREYIGVMDIRMAASIEGQFGIIIPTFFEEVYHLSVRVKRVGDMPEWVCRVLPDGIRDLRTSFDVKKAEFPPDFREIWK